MITKEHVNDIQCREHEPSLVKEQQMKRPPLESIYSEVEEHVLGPWQRIRQPILTPIAVVLSRLGISADMLSFASVLFGLGFFLLAPFQFAIAFWLLVASVICDGLDGVEARLRRSNTPRGSFTDMFCDEAVVAFSVAGKGWGRSINSVLGFLLWFLYSSVYTLLV